MAAMDYADYGDFHDVRTRKGKYPRHVSGRTEPNVRKNAIRTHVTGTSSEPIKLNNYMHMYHISRLRPVEHASKFDTDLPIDSYDDETVVIGRKPKSKHITPKAESYVLYLGDEFFVYAEIVIGPDNSHQLVMYVGDEKHYYTMNPSPDIFDKIAQLGPRPKFVVRINDQKYYYTGYH